MDNVMETGRLFLREFLVTDAEDIYALNLDPIILQYTGDEPFSSIESARDFLAGYNAYRKYGFGRWAVIDKSGGRFVGWCGLKMNEEKFVDIGFRFFRAFWNRGYATESASACIDFGFYNAGLQEIIGRSSKQNKASIRVLEKINMKFWKEDRCDGIPDAVYYRMKDRINIVRLADHTVSFSQTLNIPILNLNMGFKRSFIGRFIFFARVNHYF